MCRWQALNAKEGSVMRSTVLATPQRISPRQMSLLAAAPLAGILSFPMWLSPSNVVIREFDAADVLQLLTILCRPREGVLREARVEARRRVRQR
jgi:hypothetical protein